MPMLIAGHAVRCATRCARSRPRAARRPPRPGARGNRRRRGRRRGCGNPAPVSSPVSVRSVNSRCDDSMRPAGSSHVLAPQRVLDVGDRELPRGEAPPGRARCASRSGAPPFRRTLATPGTTPKPVDQVALGVVGELEHVQRVAREVDEHDRLGVDVHLADIAADRPRPAGARRRATTRSRTSLAASSMSRSAIELESMLERPSTLCEVSLVTPSRPATRSSMTCVILVSTTSAEAPRVRRIDRHHRRLDVRDIRGSAAADAASSPRITSSRRCTVANTGRWTDSSESFTASRASRSVDPRRAAAAARASRAAPSRSFCVPSITTWSPAASPCDDLHRRPRGAAGPDLALRHGVALDARTRTRRPARAPAPAPVPAARRCAPRESSTVRNMPGLSRPPRIGHQARTVTERVLGSTRESMLDTLPCEDAARDRRRCVP